MCRRRFPTSNACSLFALAVLGAVSAPAADAPRSLNDLSGPWQLFVDDHLVAGREHVVRTYHAFEKHPGNPVLTKTTPWEGLVYVYGTVLPAEDGSGYRLWYQSLGREPEVTSILYATSPDGLHWEKPALGIRDFGGSKDNNLFFPRDHANGLASVIHTPWDPDPARQYRIMNFDKGGYWASYSPDGLHLTDASGNPVFTGGGDVGQFLWDPHAGQYVGYVKVNVDVCGLRRRAVARIVADDIEHWSEPELILAPDSIDDRWAEGVQRGHFYGLSAFAYESMYLGLLWIFQATDQEGYYLGPAFAELVSSRDGIEWQREEGDRPPILPVGGPGEWDRGQLYTATQPLVEGDTIRLYYGACDGTHGSKLNLMACSVGLATLRKDGFASLDAMLVEGNITTKPLAGLAGELHVNADTVSTVARGWLRVEVLEREGGVVPGYSREDCDVVQGDEIDRVVTWGDRRTLPGGHETLRLRFILKDASLYSFMAGANVRVVEPPRPVFGALYTFESADAQVVRDELAADGGQVLHLAGAGHVDDDSDAAAFGGGSLVLDERDAVRPRMDVPADLGTRFTLAAAIRCTAGPAGRILSSHEGPGVPPSSELVFDIIPGEEGRRLLRLICHGIEVRSSPFAWDGDRYRHVAVTCDRGDVRFFVDGRAAGQRRLAVAAVRTPRPLTVGSDAWGGGPPLTGRVDDLLICGKALSAAQVLDLAEKGATATLAVEQAR